MIGRFAGSIGAFQLSGKTKTILYIVVPFAAFFIVLMVNALSGVSVYGLYPYAICVAVMVVAFFIGQQRPARTLSLFGLLGVVHDHRYNGDGAGSHIRFYKWWSVLLDHVAFNFRSFYNGTRKIYQPGFIISCHDDTGRSHYTSG